MRNTLGVVMLSICAAGCAHARAQAQRSEPGEARALTFAAVACWLGPVWQDALNAPAQDRVARSEEQCRFVAQHTWGHDDKVDLERLRALERNAVGDLVARVDSLARSSGDGDRRALVELLHATANAQRDNMWARRAADKVKLDLAGQRARSDLTSDERAALDPVERTRSLETLATLHAGPLSADAHALGIVCAMDRIEAARGLPRRFEIAVAGPALELLFGIAPPALPSDVRVEVAPHVSHPMCGSIISRASPAPLATRSRPRRPRRRSAIDSAGRPC